MAPITTSRAAAQMISDSTYLAYPDSGHAITITDVERVNRDLLQFLDTVN